MQDILPNTRARGTRAFRPSLAGPPSSSLVDEDESGGGSATNVGPPSSSLVNEDESGGGSATNVGSAVASSAVASDADIVMHPSGPPDTPPRSSISAGKRKHSEFSQDQILLPPPTSSKSSTSFSGKKRSADSRSTSAQGTTSSARSPFKVTTAVVMNGMQSSINRLTDAVEKSIATPEGPSTHRDAVEHLQDMEDYLTTAEKLELISQFEESEVVASTYLSLRDEVLRRAWVRKRLGSVSGGASL
jgi:hypothetical protein